MSPDPFGAAVGTALAAEAMRLLLKLLEGADLVEQAGLYVRVAFDIDQETFERLCLWRAAQENDEEDDPLEDGGDRERDD